MTSLGFPKREDITHNSRNTDSFGTNIRSLSFKSEADLKEVLQVSLIKRYVDQILSKLDPKDHSNNFILLKSDCVWLYLN